MRTRGLGGNRSMRRAVGAAACLLLLAGCGGGDTADDSGDDTGDGGATATTPAPADGRGASAGDAVFPGAEWDRVEPSEAGLAAGELDALMTYLEENQSYCGMVVQGGRVVAEEYWGDMEPDTNYEVFSASKSVTSTLVGIAQDQGHLSIDDPASTWISEWVGTPSEAVTVRNLVSNDSGRHYDFQTDYGQMALSVEDKTQFSIDLDQQHDPGTHWDYNNSAIQTLERVIEEATGQDMADYAEEVLFEPIGMTSEIDRDPAGNPLAFMGVQAGCDDMARFGYLFLRDGRWGDEQIVSSEWVTEATAASQDLNERYGFLWWRGFEGLPDDTFAALGLGNQIVLVIPSLDMVVVRIGAPPADGSGLANQGAMITEMAARVTAAADA